MSQSTRSLLAVAVYIQITAESAVCMVIQSRFVFIREIRIYTCVYFYVVISNSCSETDFYLVPLNKCNIDNKSVTLNNV